MNEQARRTEAARLLRKLRAHWHPGGTWARREWNQMALAAAYNFMERMRHYERRIAGQNLH